jgi:predicted phage-related endonuclease
MLRVELIDPTSRDIDSVPAKKIGRKRIARARLSQDPRYGNRLAWFAIKRSREGAVFEAKFMLPWSFSDEGAADKHMAQLQHNMLVAGTKKSVLSIINGGGKWIELLIEADPIYQTILIAAEKAFWRAAKTGKTPVLFDCEPPKPRIEAVRVAI